MWVAVDDGDKLITNGMMHVPYVYNNDDSRDAVYHLVWIDGGG